MLVNGNSNHFICAHCAGTEDAPCLSRCVDNMIGALCCIKREATKQFARGNVVAIRYNVIARLDP